MTLCHTHRKNDPFTRLNKSIVFDSSISLKAKGILCIAFSRPDDWTFYKNEMLKHCTEGEAAFDSGIKELEKAGYLHRNRKQDKKTGKMKGWEWHFFEEPISEEEFKKSYRNGGFADIGKTPMSGKSGPTKKDNSTKKDNNKSQPSSSHGEAADDVAGVSPSASCCSSASPCYLDKLKLSDAEKVKVKARAARNGRSLEALTARVLAWAGRSGDYIACNTILKDWDSWVGREGSSKTNPPSPKASAIYRRNLLYSRFKSYHGQNAGPVDILVAKDSLCLSASNMSVSYSFDDSAFEERASHICWVLQVMTENPESSVYRSLFK